MVTKVKDRPYFFVIITGLLKDNVKCLVNKQPKIEDKKKWGRSLTFVTILVCMLFGTPSLLSFQFFVIVFYTCHIYTYVHNVRSYARRRGVVT